MDNGLRDKSLILGVSGGIAAYKSVELLRLFTKAGASVRVVMTRSACEFVGPLTFEALSGQAVCKSLFDHADASIRHIDWAQSADAAVIAPATGNIIGKLAGGIADDALSTFLMATTCPVVVCPSMNTHMYLHPSVQRNLDILRADGHIVLEPDAGELACNTTGPGRLPEPPFILDRLQKVLTPQDLAGKQILVSAGPTREPIDPVRYLSNPSTGKMGYAIARAAEQRGAVVTLVSGPTELAAPANVELIRVQTATEMAEAVLAESEKYDVIIKTAAVSDYRPQASEQHKIKKAADVMTLELTPNRDILKAVGERKKAHQILVGFAAETRDLKHNAQQKLDAKNLDLIVGNIVGQADSGFGAETNRVNIFSSDGGVEELPLLPKAAVAHNILDRILAFST